MSRAITYAPLAALLLAALVPLASAHITSYAGGYAIKVGWDQEPSESSVYNHVTMDVWDNATGNVISGITTDSLKMTVAHAGQSRDLDYEESDDTPGHYAAPIVPSEPGLYVVHLEGKINATPVSLDFHIEDVKDIAESTFPAKNDTSAQDVAQLKSDVKTLQDEVAALQAKVNAQSSTPATVTKTTTKGVPAVGVAGALAVVAFAAAILMRRRG
jgi:hypothetical protein